MEHIIEVDDLLHGIGRPSLLSIAKGGVGDKDLLGGIDQLNAVVEFNATYFIVRENIPKQIGLSHILQLKSLPLLETVVEKTLALFHGNHLIAP
jgi:hypothetical protein